MYHLICSKANMILVLITVSLFLGGCLHFFAKEVKLDIPDSEDRIDRIEEELDKATESKDAD